MEKQKIAVFDFDHTIVNTETSVTFIKFLLKRNKIRLAFALLFSPIAIFLLLHSLTRHIGISFFSWFATVGLTPRKLMQQFYCFVDLYFEPPINGSAFQEAIQKLQWHAEKGHQIVVLSGSSVRLLKKILHKILPSEVKVQAIGSIEGMYLGGCILKQHCFGQNKIQMAYRAGVTTQLWDYGYSDSSTDFPMLIHCKEKHLINPRRRTQKKAEKKLGENLFIHQWNPIQTTSST
ncbi:MAG: phosphoserine phosphatase [bacterium]|jgi:phosphoserine phosphatase